MKKTSIIKSLLVVLVCGVLANAAFGQTVPPIVGQTININGQTFLLMPTNGTFITTTTGPGGSATITTPTTEAQALNQIRDMLAANNPTNRDYYNSTNEIEARLGGIYEQNSGEGAAIISITYWRAIGGVPLGLEAGLLQGNQSGTSGTAGCYSVLNYRRVIGDVAAIGGIGGGYDNYNAKPFALVKVGVEYRLSRHVGTWVDLNYALESKGAASRGFGFAAGACYAF